MATRCFAPLQGQVVRITELTCGVPVTGNAVAVSEGIITVGFEAEIEEGDEFVQKNAAGNLCVNKRSPDALKRFNLTIDWCNVDPTLFEIIMNVATEADGADTVGWRDVEGTNTREWALELWTGLTDVGDCGDTGEWGYILVPRITGAMYGDYSVGNEVVNFQTTGYTVGSSGWGVGPYDVIGSPAAPLDVAITSTQHRLIRTTEVAPPTAACGASVVS